MEIRGAVPFGDLPLADRFEPWDRAAADQHVRRWASSDHSGDKDKIDWGRYRKAFFWYDSENPESFGSYKLQFADIRNGDLVAIPRGIFACAAAIQGARGGVDIPDDDVDAVKSAIEKYYAKMSRKFNDDTIIAPWQRSSAPDRETRIHRADGMSIVQRAGDASATISGYVALYNTPSDDLGGFREIILPGAFAPALERNDDIVCLYNHDANYVLGRTSAGTLTLREDDRGLYIACQPPATQWARDLLVSIKRGDVRQGSFGFRVGQDEWTRVAGDSDSAVRRVITIERLYDVSVVTSPAYPATEVVVRASCARYGIDYDEFQRALLLHAHGVPLSDRQFEVLRDAAAVLDEFVPHARDENVPKAETKPQGRDGDVAPQGRRLDLLRRKLMLAEL